MKQQPARTKYRKVHKGRNRGSAKGGNFLAFGDYGIQSLSRGDLTASQLEAIRVAINRKLKRKCKLYMRVFPHKPRTKKPLETRMGKGKGNVEYYVATIKPGAILAELGGDVSISAAREAMRLADAKLPFKCRFISREEQEACC